MAAIHRIVLAMVGLLLVVASAQSASRRCSTQVLVVGGGTSGIAAGVQAARMGVDAMIVEETPWLGGMLTAAGVSAVDGNYNLRASFWGEFLDSLATHYGSLDALKTGWVSNVQFEPSVGNRIFHNIAAKQKQLRVLHGYSPLQVTQHPDEHWTFVGVNATDTLTVDAKVIIDATELGDVAALAGVKYDLGMESKHLTGEDIAPDSANNIVQDMTFTATLKQYDHDVTIQRPAGYDPSLFACCCANPLCTNPREPDRLWQKDMMLSYGRLPGNKYMINWPIEGNDFYANIVEMSHADRRKAIERAKHHTLCFVYFLQHELGYNTIGIADDEYPTPDHLPLIPYHRESRRIHGLVRFTYNHAHSPYSASLYRTNIAVGDYPVDHHHSRYTGSERLPRLYFHPIPSFGVPLGVMIPQGVNRMIVAEKSVSVSNIINGTTRLQPVVMQLGTAAGALAALAVKQGGDVNGVAVRDVQNAVLDAGGYLMPLLDAEVQSPLFAPLQRVACTGLLHGEGKRVGWSNQFWIGADSVLTRHSLALLHSVYASHKLNYKPDDQPVTVAQAVDAIAHIAKAEKLMSQRKAHKLMRKTWQQHFATQLPSGRHITRGEYAVLVDAVLQPFARKPVDINGNFANKK